MQKRRVLKRILAISGVARIILRGGEERLCIN